MITGFEEKTQPLTHFEETILVPLIVKTWNGKPYGEEGLTKMSDMVQGTKTYLYGASKNDSARKKVKGRTGVRRRRVIHYIRAQGLVKGLVVNSKGYYKTEDPDEIKDYNLSCYQRSNSFLSTAKSMERQYRDLQKLQLNKSQTSINQKEE